MQSSKLKKIFTISSFIILIGAFVAYRMDAFDKEDINNSIPQKESTIDKSSIDSQTVNTVDTPRANPTMMPTSKSIILIDDIDKTKSKERAGKNSKQKNVAESTNKKLNEEINIMGSSKSGIIFSPEQEIDTAGTNSKE